MSKRSTWRISTVLSLGGLQLSAASLSAVSISTIAHNTDRRSIFGLWKIQLQLFRSYCWPLLPSEAPWIASHQPTKPHPSLRAGSSPPLSTMAQIASTRGATMDKIMSTWWIDINTTKTASDIETLLSKTHFLTSSTVPKCNLTFLICWMRTAAKNMPFFDIDPQHLIQQGHPARSWYVDDTVEFETRNYRGEAQTTSGLIVVERRSATDSAWSSWVGASNLVIQKDVMVSWTSIRCSVLLGPWQPHGSREHKLLRIFLEDLVVSNSQTTAWMNQNITMGEAARLFESMWGSVFVCWRKLRISALLKPFFPEPLSRLHIALPQMVATWPRLVMAVWNMYFTCKKNQW